jgi:diguanylate cyclase (GGDEF)-like protein
MSITTRMETNERALFRAQLPFAALCLLVLAVVSTAAHEVALDLGIGEGWRFLVAPFLFFVVGFPALLLLVGRPYNRRLLADAEVVRRREEGLRREAGRQEFEGRLHRALELADDEPAALAVVTRAFAALSSERPTELLLADSSRSHLHPVAVNPEGGHPGCPVPSPAQCPAVRRGQTAVFDSGDELDACPHLRGRATGDRSAVCAPVTILGTAVGVLHATGEPGRPPGPDEVVGLESIANQAGARLGMIRALARSEVQASTDPLTGLLNRRSMEEVVRPILEAGRAYAVVMGDLDHFKSLNDTYGHDAGDRALRLFAGAVRRSLRPVDVACRYGGEEFLLVLPDCGAVEAEAAAERLRESITLANLGSGAAPGFTASFGVADSASLTSDFDTLVQAADAALRRAKQAGRDRVETAVAA